MYDQSSKKSLLKLWIIIVLGVVIVGEGVYLTWYYLKGPGAKTKTVTVVADSSSEDSSETLDTNEELSPSPSSSTSPSPSVSPSASPSASTSPSTSPSKSPSATPSPTISAPSGVQKLTINSCWANNIAYSFPSSHYKISSSKPDTVSFQIDQIDTDGTKNSSIQILGPGVVGDCNKFDDINATYTAYLASLPSGYTITDGPNDTTVGDDDAINFTYEANATGVNGSHKYTSENTLVRYDSKRYLVIRSETSPSGITPTLGLDSGYKTFLKNFSFDY